MKKMQMIVNGNIIRQAEISDEDFKNMINEGDKYWMSQESKDSGHTVYWKILD